MALFLYSKIEFVFELGNEDSDTIPVGIFAEWFDGYFWRLSLCGAKQLRFQDILLLDPPAQKLLKKPFALLYGTADRYIKRQGWFQQNHTLEDFTSLVYPPHVSLQTRHLFTQEMSEDEDPDEIFDDISLSIPGETQQSHWFRMDSRVGASKHRCSYA